jgi:hypothetical protein
MTGYPGRLLCTLQLMRWALFPGAEPGTSPPEFGGVLRCAPRQIRGGMGRLLNSRGELRLFFPGCLAIAAPLVLFRLKREGFSRCSVEASDQGLLVQGRR